jgi:hypothetical protein
MILVKEAPLVCPFNSTFFFLLSGFYGTRGEGTSSTVPPVRYGATSWTATDGRFFLLGGFQWNGGKFLVDFFSLMETEENDRFFG